MSMKRLMAAQVDEMLRHKWIESEKAGHDLGEACMLQWIKEHAAEFRHEYNLRHMERLDDGTTVQSICVYVDEKSSGILRRMIDLPDGWVFTDCHFGLPWSAKPYLADQLGGSARIMVTMIGRGDDGIYAAGVVEGMPIACICRVAEPIAHDCDRCDVEWACVTAESEITGTFDTDPRQIE